MLLEETQHQSLRCIFSVPEEEEQRNRALNLLSLLKCLKVKEGTELTRQKAEVLIAAKNVAEPTVQLCHGFTGRSKTSS